MLSRVPNLVLPGITEVVNFNQSVTSRSPSPSLGLCFIPPLRISLNTCLSPKLPQKSLPSAANNPMPQSS